jgi:hypothetical protein
MLAPMALLAEREQPLGYDELPTAEADRLEAMDLDLGTLASAFTASARTGTHLLAQPTPSGAGGALVLAAASPANGGARAAVLSAERGGSHLAPTLAYSHHAQLRPSKVSVESRANVSRAYAGRRPAVGSRKASATSEASVILAISDEAGLTCRMCGRSSTELDAWHEVVQEVCCDARRVNIAETPRDKPSHGSPAST